MSYPNCLVLRMPISRLPIQAYPEESSSKHLLQTLQNQILNGHLQSQTSNGQILLVFLIANPTNGQRTTINVTDNQWIPPRHLPNTQELQYPTLRYQILNSKGGSPILPHRHNQLNSIPQHRSNHLHPIAPTTVNRQLSTHQSLIGTLHTWPRVLITSAWHLQRANPTWKRYSCNSKKCLTHFLLRIENTD